FDIDRVHPASTPEWQMTRERGGCHAGDQAHAVERLPQEGLTLREIPASAPGGSRDRPAAGDRTAGSTGPRRSTAPAPSRPRTRRTRSEAVDGWSPPARRPVSGP